MPDFQSLKTRKGTARIVSVGLSGPFVWTSAVYLAPGTHTSIPSITGASSWLRSLMQSLIQIRALTLFATLSCGLSTGPAYSLRILRPTCGNAAVCRRTKVDVGHISCVVVLDHASAPVPISRVHLRRFAYLSIVSSKVVSRTPSSPLKASPPSQAFHCLYCSCADFSSANVPRSVFTSRKHPIGTIPSSFPLVRITPFADL